MYSLIAVYIVTLSTYIAKANDILSRKDPIVQTEENRLVTLHGRVVEVLRGGLFKIKLDSVGIVRANLSGKLRLNKVQINLFDKVTVEISRTDYMTVKQPNFIINGRIIKRD